MTGKKSKIQEAFEMFDALFNGEYDPLEFSVDMEDFLFKNYDIMHNENFEVAHYLNQDVPDLCAEGEPNFDPTHMITELKKIYDVAKAMCEKSAD